MSDGQKENLKSIPLATGLDDKLDFGAEAKLRANERAVYEKRRLVGFLENELLDTKAELKRLHRVEMEHGRLSYARSIQIALTVISVIAISIGGGVVSSCPRKDEFAGFCTGWSILALGILLNIVQAVVPVLPKKPKTSN